jgi:hypothetical protein
VLSANSISGAIGKPSSLAIVFWATLLFPFVADGQDQPALVTFYSVGCLRCGKAFAVSIGAGSVEMAYRGAIYDGKFQLIKKMTPNRFVTLRMKPGPHSFAGTNPNGFKAKEDDNEERHLQIVLEAGQHYFIRFNYKNKGVYVVRHFTPVLTTRECREAFDEGAKTEPLRPKDLDKERLLEVQASPYFPVCEGAAMLRSGKNP